VKQCSIYIDGKFLPSMTGEWFESINPYTRESWANIPKCDHSDVRLAIDSARRAFRDPRWFGFRASSRGAVLRRIGDVLSTQVESLAEMETLDIGKPIKDTLKQIKYLPEWFYYYGGLADKIAGDVIPTDQEGIFNYTQYEPLGVISAITPWNSPLMLSCWKLAPALAAGNTVVLKPSECASVSTCEFMKVIHKAKVPAGVVNLVTGFPKDLGSGLINDPNIAKVTFTGSSDVGSKVASVAGGNITPCTLELGGKSAQIVCEDARLEDAAAGVTLGIFPSNGQSCVAGSRLLVHKAIKREFLKILLAKVSKLRMGDPRNRETQIGPIANEAQFIKALKYIETGKREGAVCILGGAVATRQGCTGGWFIEPTIFTDVTSDMAIAQEEIFGPVLSVMEFTDDEQALNLANDVKYGLAAGVWTESIARAHKFIQRLDCGTVYVNTYKNVSVASPAGGFKKSGIGRENGIGAFSEFSQIKCVWLKTRPAGNE
jgi:(Z)-2-((N-methylformamido)methylene)-5-hydroxybutyrolactone dehydrogenase